MPSISAAFTVTVRDPTPTPAPPPDPRSPLGRTTFDKQFQGPLEATSVVEMVSVGTDAGPLAYVALEHVTGRLDGLAGTFVLRHAGLVLDGVPALDLRVVPGSGTGELAGLSGEGTIEHTPDGARLQLTYTV